MTGVVTVEIQVDGERMNAGYQILSIDVVKAVNRIPSAQLVLLDGNAAKQTFAVSNSNFFELGKLLTIGLYYEGQSGDRDLVFTGLITQHQIQANSSQSRLTIELKDPAFKLTRQRKSRAFVKQKDSDIIEQIIGETGLTPETIETTTFEHPEIVQFACSDWDFLLSRAEVNGQWVMLDGGEFRVMPPPLSGSPKHTFNYGISEIYELEMDADLRHQYDTVQATTWDSDEQAIAPPVTPSQPVSLAQGTESKLSPATLASAIGTEQYDLSTSSSLDETETQAWVDAQTIKSRLSLLRGRLRVPGFSDLQLGDLLELDGVGEQFQGMTPVTGIRHQVSVQGWVTEIQFGLAANWFAERRDLTDLPANGLFAGVNGLQIAVVEAYEDDPDGRFRVRVRLPMLPDSENVIWARLATLDAGSERGACFRPEPEDEVILGFLNQDPRQAVILGSLYSKKNVPPLPVEADNIQRGFVTPEQIKLVFDDQEKSILLETPGENRMVWLDEEGITIADQHNNKITLNADGIQLTSEKDIAIAAGGKIELTGDQDISLTAGGNVILKGSNIDVK